MAAMIAAALPITNTHPQSQTQNKKAPAKTQSTARPNPQQALPLDDARNETLMLFWADPPSPPNLRPVARREPSGSAVWIGENGYLATCYHVIKGWNGPFKIGIAREPYVTEGSMSISISGAVNTFVASLVASDENADVAILKAEIPPSKIQLMPLVSGDPMGTPVTPQDRLKPRGATLKTAPFAIILVALAYLYLRCYPRAVFLWGDAEDWYASILNKRKLVWSTIVLTLLLGIVLDLFALAINPH